jgi:hypothetical protein
MKLLLTMLACLIAASAGAQTIKNLGYNTTNGQVVYSGTNTLTFTNPLNLTNTVRVGVFGQGGASGFAGRTSGGNLALYGTNVTTAQPSFYGFDGFNNTAFSAGVARTNLGLSTTDAVTFQSLVADQLQVLIGTNLYVNLADDVSEFFVPLQLEDELAVVGAATFSTNVTVNGNLSVGSFTTTTPSTWALDATQTAAATNGVLALPSNANVIRLTNNNAISGVSGGVLGAFYYLVNQTTNAVTISNVGGITVQGGTPLTLGANQAATLVATGATNASVAARGDLNDVTLGGTLNKAPAQTADSADSLMTRDLSDARFYPLASYWLKAGDMDTFNGAGTGQATWAEVSPIVNMVTPFSRAPRVVPAADGATTEGIFPIPVGWPAGATVRTTTYFALAPLQSTTDSIFIRARAYWTTNSSILTPVRTAMSDVFPESSSSDQLFTGTGTNAEYFAVTNTFTFATNANPQNRSIMFGRSGTQATDTATNTIYFIASHVELLP